MHWSSCCIKSIMKAKGRRYEGVGGDSIEITSDLQG